MSERDFRLCPQAKAFKRFPSVYTLLAVVAILFYGVLPARMLAGATRGQDSTGALERHNPLLLGAAWYPEQWPESRWEEDLRLMEAAHITFARVGEFAWSRMEPEEGKYDLDWLERAIAKAAQHHVAIVLGTPTPAPPAWLTQAYPDTLRVGLDGRRAVHGNRQQFSFTSPRYRQFCHKIADQMAKRFGHNRNVIGWQIDNEYAEVSYDDYTKEQFQQWLKAKYKTLDNLNAHWTTAYWSQTYFDWSQIPLGEGYNNPALRLEWKRFVSDTWASYQQNQIDAIRPHADQRQFITTNFMGFFEGFDHYVVAKALDLTSWDDYVGSGHADPDANGVTHDLTRGFKRQNFWVMETQPGAVNWADVNNFLDRGEVRAMAWQAIGHGAEAVEYWQWRSALNGQEQYHGTLVGADGTPVPLYEEVAQIGAEFVKAGDALRDTSPKSEVAMLYDYDSRWAIDFQQHTEKYDQLGLLRQYYRAIRMRAQSVDIVNPYVRLDGYKLVLAPDLNLLPQPLAQHLLAYVRNGGQLVLGPRSGMKDEYNALLTQRQPGYLVDALGGRVEQFYALEKDFPVSGKWGAGTATIWAEQMEASAPDAEVLLKYGEANGWLDGQAAAISRAVGKGRITYIGAILDDKTMSSAADWIVEQSGTTPIFGAVPDGIEVSRREGVGKQVFVLINFKRETQQVTLPRAMDVVLGSAVLRNRVEIPAYGVEVLVDKK
ncbi:MAG TPA: beta-galactosidase [Candidatus Cybelea sp.]|nr:beta-galactosidase [Candidatus Cybelea sp.]